MVLKPAKMFGPHGPNKLNHFIKYSDSYRHDLTVLSHA